MNILPRPRRFRFQNKKEATLTPAIILINALIAGVLLLMVFFIYNYVTSEEGPAPTRTTPTESAPEPDNTDQPPDTTEPVNTTPVSMTKGTTTPPFGGDNAEFPLFTPGVYDDAFFADDFFIGDSIMTGIHLYGFIPTPNVFAVQGLNPNSVKTEEIGGKTAYEKVAEMNPARIYIMLGSNGVAFMTGASMVSHMEEFISELKEIVPNSEIILLTIPPVTAEYEASYPERTTDINEFNALLKASALRNGYFLIDTAAILKDGAGHLADNYAEADGLHFKGSAYKAVLSLIQFTIENS